ncbi:MAG: protein kinase [Planctomycetes bacterium]|nr:protein kinase [Planctomycetota bacterium]
MAKLVVRKGRNVGMEYKLNADRLVCGRRSASPIPIIDAKASREHAEIIRKDGKFFVNNLSRNGTYVNEKLASQNGEGPTPLTFGDKIRIGETVLEMVDEKAEKIEIEIPGYKILEKIGAGGMGNVYKAKQLSMDRVVALKVLNEKYGGNREFVERFIREARAAGKLNHPNVIHVHDVSKANGRHYFSMEFVDGNSVKELLRIQRKVKLDQALDIVIQTGKALEFAHENGIVHRDIKPDNIMLTKDGVVKIADLGIAKTFDEGGSGQSSQHQNRVMGTPHYMAPEQALGKEIDHRVDIYSLGATLYHMLTGTTPFTGSTAHEVLKAHIQDSLAPIQDLVTDVPDPVCFIVERMMAKLPEKRYPNMTKLIQDLERAQQGAHEGIERIAAGDSTIMRAVTDEEAQQVTKKKGNITEELSTGVQTPVGGLLLYGGVAVVFLAVVALVVLLLRGRNEDDPQTPPDGPGTTQQPGPQPSSSGSGAAQTPQTNEQAEKLLAEAKQLLDVDGASREAEARLTELIANYPTLPLRDEAERLKAGIAEKRKQAALKQAQERLDAARKYEQTHGEDPGEFKTIADQYAEVAKQAGDAAAVRDEADRKFKEYEEKRRSHAQQALQGELDNALAQAKGPAAQKNYDGARQPLEAFIQAHKGSQQGVEAEKRLAELEAEAQRHFDEARADAERKAKDAARPLPMALETWERYLAEVQDGKRRGEAEKARDAVLATAQNFAQQERAEVKQLAAATRYEEAIQRQRKFVAKLSGTKWEKEEAGRDAQLEKQKKLHEKVIKNIQQREGAPLPLPFELVFAKIDVKTWAVAGTRDDVVNLDPIPKNAAPGMSKKFAEFEPSQLYQLYKLFLTNPAPEDHAGLHAFCLERGLNAEAEAHKKE